MTQTPFTTEPSISSPKVTLDEALVCSLSPSTIKPGLERVQRYLTAMGSPQNAVPVIHVAGTNGKGSVCHMLTQILYAAGYRVGTTISPHLVALTERICLNGQPISDDVWEQGQQALRRVMAQQPDWEKPTYFEAIILLAFWAFKHWQVDVAIVETGMGGRLDATNVVETPLLTAITSIGLDHTEFLGDTLAKVAREKAGIIKPNVPVVLGLSIAPEAHAVIQSVADSQQAAVVHSKFHALTVQSLASSAQILFDTERNIELSLPLHGAHQVENLAVALEMVSQLALQGWKISNDAIQQGLAKAYWPARCDIVTEQQWVVDGSHNPQGWQSLAETLPVVLPNTQWQMLIAVKASKDVTGLVSLLSVLSPTRVVCTQGDPNWGEYHRAEDLRDRLSALTTAPMVVEPDWQQALSLLQADSDRSLYDSSCWVLVTGSLHLAGAVRHAANLGP